ncbi:MAG TPA: DUF1648 domain-containing protein, partial [Blastocatellia bacterium]|nr:DUF1648 domain-containing protein [Blastocatellia bacterium]
MSFNDRLPIKSISGWTPYVVLLVAGVVLWLKLDSFPESWPVHWNARGEADQWATKTPLGILFPIIVGAVLCVLFELIKALVASATIRRSKERMRLEVAEALAEMNRDLLTIMQTATATIFALLAVLLPAGAQVNAR